jgi:hypothetical protein
MVRRDGARIRCFTRNGHDWADRFPAIVDAALRLNAQAFLVDEAVIGRAINTATRWRLDREARRGRSGAQQTEETGSDTGASTASSIAIIRKIGVLG